MNRAMIDSFSGAVADLTPGDRTPEKVIACLHKNPRVSVWDMDTDWLRSILWMLVRQGKIVDDGKEPYPWIRYKVIE